MYLFRLIYDIMILLRLCLICRQMYSHLPAIFFLSFASLLISGSLENAYLHAQTRDYQFFYNRGDFKNCALDLQKKSRSTPLNRAETIVYSECLFQNKQYKKSIPVFERLIKQGNNDPVRAASRLIDIIKVGEKDVDLKLLTDFILQSDQGKMLTQKLAPQLLQKNQVKFFLKINKKYPVHLNRQQWSIITAASDEPGFHEVLNSYQLQSHKKQLLQANWYYTHGEPQKAHSLLDKLIHEKNDADAIELKAEIYWQNNDQEQALQTVEKLKQNGYTGYIDLSTYLFEKGRPRQALETVEEAIDKGYPLYDRLVFYTMSMGNFVEAAYLLEKLKSSNQLQRYRYQSLYQDFFRQGTRKDYYRGVKKLAQENENFCDRAVHLLLPWGSPGQISAGIKDCPKITRNTGLYRSLLISLERKKRYGVIIHLLEDKINKELADNAKQPAEKKDPATSHLQRTTQAYEKYLYAMALLLHNPDRGHSGDKTTRSKKALHVFALVTPGDLPEKRHEQLYYMGLSYIHLKEFKTAAGFFKKTLYADATVQQAQALFYGNFFDELKQLNDSAKSATFGSEKPYFQAAWSLQQNQMKQTEKLLEDYLVDPGQFGNRAVYILFVMKYFSHNSKVRELAMNLYRYPLGLSEENWQPLRHYIERKPADEFDVFCRYWYARYLMLQNQKIKAKTVLTGIKSSEHSKILIHEVEYLLTSLKNDKEKTTDFLVEFPASPFRIYLTP